MGAIPFFLLLEATVLCGWASLPLDTRENSRLGMMSGTLQSSLMGLPYPPTPYFLQENHHFSI